MLRLQTHLHIKLSLLLSIIIVRLLRLQLRGLLRSLGVVRGSLSLRLGGFGRGGGGEGCTLVIIVFVECSLGLRRCYEQQGEALVGFSTYGFPVLIPGAPNSPVHSHLLDLASILHDKLIVVVVRFKQPGRGSCCSCGRDGGRRGVRVG